MPLVTMAKARRRKPQWQDIRPDSKGLRDAYAIASRNVERWSRAYMAAVRNMIRPEDLKEMKRRYAEGQSPDNVLDALQWPNLADPSKDWQRTIDKLTDAYGRVINESQELPVKVQKQKAPTTPINPLSTAWARDKGAALVAETIPQTRAALRNIVMGAMDKGLRAGEMIAEIENNVGLLEREQKAVTRRAEAMRAAGVPESEVQATSKRYAKQLLRKRAQRIARTETVEAQNRGLLDSWREKTEQGKLPANIVREWVAAPESPRTCEICLELDGQQTSLGEPFESAVLGTTVMTPPSHPHCFPGDIKLLTVHELAKTARQYDGSLVTVSTAEGSYIRCTPEHPILTENGWREACDLEMGDIVYSGWPWELLQIEGVADEPTFLERVKAAGLRREKIWMIGIIEFSGLVYNCETRSGFYMAREQTANRPGLLVHNCRCTMVLRRKRD